MEKSVQITGIIVLGVVIVSLLGYTAFSSLVPSTSNTISANGEAQVEIVPDLVGVYFNVQTKGTTSQEATDSNAEIVDALIVNLVKQGFERKQIQTQNFNVYPSYTYVNRNRVSDGYQATHAIKVELSTEDATKIGIVIDAGVDAGAGISYINFELSPEKQKEAKAEAIKLAAEDAKIRAESIAEGLGKHLGSLVSTSDSNFNYNPWRLYESMDANGGAAEAKAATTNIQPGDQTIYANVRAVFRIR